MNVLSRALNDFILEVTEDKNQKKCKFKKLFGVTDKFITFNYSCILEDIYSITLDNILHIHGVARSGHVSNDDYLCGVYFHVILTRLFDRHGFASYFATKKFIRQVKKIKPIIIHLHNIHGYYLNIKVLFDYLKTLDIPIIWTLHDCWAFTGHCTHYIAVRCGKWQDSCQDCPQKKRYPKSFVDNSKSNFLKKKAVFTGVKNLTIITPSVWLSEQVKKSFLSVYSAKTIYNGIDLNVFAPAKKYPTGISAALKSKKIILGVASVWDERKGLADFIKLAKLLSDDEAIVLVGLSRKQIALLPNNNIVGIERTENQAELVQWYSVSTLFFQSDV